MSQILCVKKIPFSNLVTYATLMSAIYEPSTVQMHYKIITYQSLFNLLMQSHSDYSLATKFKCTINVESLEWLMFGELAFEESWWKKVWQIVHAIVNYVKVTNWQIKVRRIPSIRQIPKLKSCQTFIVYCVHI